MVESAVFTEPKDQSAWFYQRWLLGERQSSVKIISAGETSGGEIFVTFNQLVDLTPVSNIKVDSNVLMSWTSLNGATRSYIWVSSIIYLVRYLKRVSSSSSPENFRWALLPNLHLNRTFNIFFTMKTYIDKFRFFKSFC